MSGPPSAEEQDLYYYGLPSLPTLIVRSSSSTQTWTNPQKPGWSAWTGTCNMYRKMLQPAGKHPLLQQLWNDATSSLRVQIIDAVSDMDWHAVDILRVGFLHTESLPPITLMVAVTPDTLPWSKGHAIALQCRAILEQHAIHDIHCEIRESVVPLRDLIQVDQPTFEKQLERCKRNTAYYATKADSYSKRGQVDVAAAY